MANAIWSMVLEGMVVWAGSPGRRAGLCWIVWTKRLVVMVWMGVCRLGVGKVGIERDGCVVCSCVAVGMKGKDVF